VDEVRFLGLPTASGGRVRSYGVMGNLFYDFDPGFFGIGPSFVQPYLGAGVGYVWTEYEKLRASAAGFTATLDDTDGRFAFQGIAGVAVPLTWLGARGLTLTAEYRFLGTLEPRVGAELRAGGPNGPVLLRREFDAGNYNHSALLGVRYAFNQPGPRPPAPVAAPVQPVAPAPATARTYLVFFDFNRADLTGRAREIVAEAAQNSRRVQSTRIEVAGHADRSGTPRYNQRLSQRRAEAVASELVARGVDRGEIGVTAFGESRPLVQTADGVREPQNRRVEIVLR
jgi:outer membrane protein OmpA-like peptidoglycan-associated protein